MNIHKIKLILKTMAKANRSCISRLFNPFDDKVKKHIQELYFESDQQLNNIAITGFILHCTEGVAFNLTCMFPCEHLKDQRQISVKLWYVSHTF